MGELFGRSCRITIGVSRDTESIRSFVSAKAISFDSLDVSFEIEKTLKSEPNKCHLKVWNLSEEHRAALEELNPPTRAGSALAKNKEKTHRAVDGIPVKIEAGYGKDLSLLWLGDLRDARSEYEKPDWVTTLESGDGEKAWQNARINVSFGPKTPVETALRAMVRALGVGEGNLSSVVQKLKIAGVGSIFPRGTVISGQVSRELTDFARSADLEWSIQNGAVQFIDRGKALASKAIKLTSGTGMIGSPTVDVDGVLKVKMQMIPDVRPGTLIVLDAARIKGNYRIEKATWTGDRAGEAWEIEVEAQRY